MVINFTIFTRKKSLHNLSFVNKHSIYLREIADEPNSILTKIDVCGGETSFNVKSAVLLELF